MKKLFGLLIAGALAAYFLLPIFTGLMAVGDRRGPKIYIESYHAGMYSFSYELRYGETPRLPALGGSERPWFYDFGDRNPPLNF